MRKTTQQRADSQPVDHPLLADPEQRTAVQRASPAPSTRVSGDAPNSFPLLARDRPADADLW
jgi:hypothetical protein